MFSPVIGAKLADAVKNGADPKTVVPDEFVIVRGGTAPMPEPGKTFSGAVGPTLESAAAAVPWGSIRTSTVAALRSRGGTVEWVPERSRYETINQQHVNVVEVGTSSFSDLRANPVPRNQRIDGEKT